MNIPLVNDDPIRINSSITYLRNNYVSQLNEDFDFSSINVLYAGVEALVSSLRDICSRYGVNIKATTSGALIKDHSTKFRALNVKNADSIEHFNVFFDDVQNQLYSFDLEVSNLANTSSQALVDLAQASYGYSDDDSDGGSDDAEFQRLLAQQQAAVGEALAGLDPDIESELIEIAADEAEGALEELQDEAKEEGSNYTPPTEAEIEDARDHVNQTWEDAQTAREEAENEAYTAWQEAQREADELDSTYADDLNKAVSDAIWATSTQQAADEAKSEADHLADMQTAISNGDMPIGTTQTGTFGDGTITVTRTGDDEYTVTVTVGDVTQTVTASGEEAVELAGQAQETAQGFAEEAQQRADEAKATATASEAKAEQSRQDYEEAQQRADEAKSQYESTSEDDGTTTITVTDGDGNPVSVTFTEDDGSEEGESLW